jgi:outer membrane protein assembly factor BamB
MSVNSRVLGLFVLSVIFGGIAAFSALGLWQTERGGQGQRNHGDAEGELAPTPISLHGWVSSCDGQGLALNLDDGTSLYVQLGSTRYAQSIGFAPQVGEGVTLLGFTGEDGLFSAITVTLDTPAGRSQVYTFRSETGQPLWSGSGRGNGTSR